jgi:5-methylcytosine-specific restriction endonuclease McrA
MVAPSHKSYMRNRAWYLAREASPEGERKRVERDQARTAEIKSGALKGPHDPRTVDHIKSLAKGGGNAKKNLRVISGTANRRKFDH